MINAYKQGKDLYATIASGVYNTSYENCLEFKPDGTLFPEGKKRRSSVKNLLLGIMYGRGIKSIAEQIGGTLEDAQKIIDDFYKSFPKVKKWMDDTEKFAKKNGYVEDLWGRRRRLPDILLPKYEVIDHNEHKDSSFNPFLNCENRELKNSIVETYENKLKSIKGKRDYDYLSSQASKDNVEIRDNSGFIAQAERQSVNARIQGGAASMTKLAMIKLGNDQILKDLKFNLLIGVHDELIGECPKENAEQVAERLCNIMKSAAEDVCDVPFKCDPDISTRWYENEYISLVTGKYSELIDSGKSSQEAFNYIVDEFSESLPYQLQEIINSQLNISLNFV